MAGALLGKDTEKYLHDEKQKNAKKKGPSRIQKMGRTLLLSLLALMTLGGLFTGATAKAAIWDLDEQITAAIVNICNPASVPYTTDTQSWLGNALGSATPMKADGENEKGNIWSTYNPQVAVAEGGNPVYIKGGDGEGDIAAPNQSTATRAWVNFLRSGENKEFVYPDHWSDRSSVDQTDPGWRDQFKGDGSKPGMYPTNPKEGDSYYDNAPTVALQSAYSAAPEWVIHPSYTRYGFETLDWTTYGSSCYSPERYLNVIPDFLYWLLVQIPTLITFGMLRITLGPELVGVFYSLVYPLTSLIGTIITPWVALIAIVIGLPFVWIKSKGSIQKILSGAAWISAMLFAISQLTTHAQAFTEFSQGLVVKVSGTFACTIANQAFAEDASTIKIGGDAIKDSQYVPVYNDDGTTKTDANGNTVWQTRTEADESVKKAINEGKTDGEGNVSLTLEDLAGVSNETSTACGSYLDGIYNAFWLGIPLQVWSEGQVGSDQAARDRTSETNGKIGWYQAILNSMYINPNDKVGQAQIQATTRWNDAGYTDLDEGKPMQWNIDGHAEGNEGDIDMSKKINNMDDDRTATVWKAVPFLLNIKFLCKDDALGAIENGGRNGADNAADYGTNKWMYDGTCITAGNGGLVQGMTGYNLIDRIGLSLVGGWLAYIIFIWTVAACVYIGYQKFVWGFMLMFAPIFLGIAAFPDEKRMNFARKYLEFCISNVIKQIMAVMILVVSVTALGKVVFPSSDAIGGDGFFIPWILKPFVAVMFLLAAALFAIPMKRIMVGAVKGDASVVTKTADMPKDAAKAAGVAIAAGAAIAATGGAGAGTMLSAAGRAAQVAGARKGGLTGALANVAGKELAGKGAATTAAANAAAEKAGVAPNDGSILGAFKQGRALKKATGTKAMSQKAALAANASANKNGAELPYAVDKNGNLTGAAQRQAKKDFVGAQKGEFWKSPEFAGMTKNAAHNDKQLSSIKQALAPEFTGKDGKVDTEGLDAAANKELGALNSNTLSRQKAIGQELLDADKKNGTHTYTDAKGALTPDGQQKLFSDIRNIDGNSVGLANTAKAHELMANDPEHYNQFVNSDSPNGNYIQALSDANVSNFGSDGSIGDKTVHAGFGAGAPVVGQQGSQAYISSNAPVVSQDMSPAQATAAIQEMGGAVGTMSPEVQTAFQKYSDTLSSDTASEADVVSAHRDTLQAVYNGSGMTQTTSAVQSQIIAPVAERGMSVSPESINQVRDSIPESSAAVRQSLSNYSEAIAEHGNGSDEARHAFRDVQTSVQHEDRGVYANVASSLPIPASIGSNIQREAPEPAPAPVSESAPTPPPVAMTGSSPAPRRAADDDVAPRRAAEDRSDPYYDDAPPVAPRRAMSEESPAPRRAVEDYEPHRADYDSPAPVSDVAPRRAAEPTYDAPEPRRASDSLPPVDDSPAPRRAAEDHSDPYYDDAPPVEPRRADYSDSASVAPIVTPSPRPERREDSRPRRAVEDEAPVNDDDEIIDDASVAPVEEMTDENQIVASDRDRSQKITRQQKLTRLIAELEEQRNKVQNQVNRGEGYVTKLARQISDAESNNNDSHANDLKGRLTGTQKNLDRDKSIIEKIGLQIEDAKNKLRNE